LVLGETLSTGTLLGALLILGGALINQARPRRLDATADQTERDERA